MKAFVNYFSNSDAILLNSGSVSKCPVSVLAAVHREIDEYEKNPTRGLFQSWQRLWDVQKKLASFFHAKPAALFLRPNVTVAMNDFILGVEIPKPGPIVITNLEYGAIINVCKTRAGRDGRDLHVIQLKIGAEAYGSDDEIMNDILRQIPDKAALLMCSHIMTGTGLKIPIAKLGDELRKRGVLFAVDGAHGPGAVHLDFSKLQSVDFYGGNLHKWFLGPKGTGFGWAHPSVQSRMRPLMGSWTTLNPSVHHRVFGDGDEFALKMLWSHTSCVAPYYALFETVDFWNELGEKQIQNRIYELQSFAEKEVKRLLRWPLLSPERPQLRGPLVAFEVPAAIKPRAFDIVWKMLEQHKVQIVFSQVDDDISFRLSPHIYNTEQEITTGLEIFRSLIDQS